MNPLVSIITVVLNNAEGLSNTIQSVRKQTYENIELIIIDGGSVDNTLDVIKKNEESIAYWISEKDSGIFDAMNKGQHRASGDYVLFLNSGDVFYNNAVLEDIFSNLDNDKQSIIIGKISCEYNKSQMWVVTPRKDMALFYSPPHQAMFIPRSIYSQYNYNRYLKMLGDRDYWLRLAKDGLYHVVTVDRIVAKYDLSGVSSDPRNYDVRIKEMMALSLIYYKKYNIKGILLELIKYFLKNVVYKVSPKRYFYLLGRYHKRA